MRFAVIYRPQTPPPPEQLPDMLKVMGDWIERHGSRVEGLDFFVGGGGMGIVDTDDSGEMARMIAEHPFTPFMEIDIRTLVDPGTALGILQAAAENR